MTRKTIFPMTRIHEPLRVDVEIDGGQVVDAWLGGMLFRGFEAMLIGRDPRDAALFTQRICGICTTAHAVAATLAQQEAFGVAPTPNGQHLTNLIYAADIIHNHLVHFYTLALFDYVVGPATPPYLPRQKGDFRLPPKVNSDIMTHAKTAYMMASRAHEMMAIFGGKAPMQQTIMPTGVTEQVNGERVAAYWSVLQELKDFVEQIYLPDVLTIADYYLDYFKIGTGYGHLMSFGMFPAPVTGRRAFGAGVIVNRGVVAPFEGGKVLEGSRFAWYADEQESRQPSEGKTTPDSHKAEAYTWIKAPRYQGLPFESGPLARGWINGNYRRGVSVMDRLVARAQETQKICRLAEEWLSQLVPGAPTVSPYTPPPQGAGSGLTDAMRGVLGHWLSYDQHKVSHYQIVTPSTWNFSPRDAAGRRGPVEEALVGTPVASADSLIEVARVIHSLDPCLTCAVHVLAMPQTQPVFV
ncbi:MAG: nickel-dependent hydrogenase large subunit [Negativicutes bacterium]|nr:nickel-dependent hydrogenase large subunit [Negativicutes bacterium]